MYMTFLQFKLSLQDFGNHTFEACVNKTNLLTIQQDPVCG